MGVASRSFVAMITLFMMLDFTLYVVDCAFYSYGLKASGLSGDMAHAQATAEAASSSSFAVVINTYKRPEMLREAILHYADVCGKRNGVGQVFVVWSELGVDPPDAKVFFFGVDDLGGSSLRKKRLSTREKKEMIERIKNRSAVKVLRMEKNSLNSRFLPIADLEGEAIFMVDDDVRVSCPSLSQGFDAWRAQPHSMVGYYPRLASASGSGSAAIDGNGGRGAVGIVYHTWPGVFLRGRFNFVLTKAAFLHRRYLEIYSGDSHPGVIRDYIDKHKNCEDVAMALLVANQARLDEVAHEPVYVEGSVSDLGLFRGISTGSGHFGTRSKCLIDLTRVYEEQGWGAPLSGDVSLRDRSWLQHFPGLWWQSRPSNFFEWMSIGSLIS